MAPLPNAITLPHKPSKLPYIRPGQFAARLGVEYDPLYVHGSREKPLEFRVPALSLEGNVTPARLTDRVSMRDALDAARRDFDARARHGTGTACKTGRSRCSLRQERQPRSMFRREPLALRERYGNTVNGTSLLLARRLVEAGRAVHHGLLDGRQPAPRRSARAAAAGIRTATTSTA